MSQIPDYPCLPFAKERHARKNISNFFPGENFSSNSTIEERKSLQFNSTIFLVTWRLSRFVVHFIHHGEQYVPSSSPGLTFLTVFLSEAENFGPVPTETFVENLVVKGNIPQDFRGEYVRNGISFSCTEKFDDLRSQSTIFRKITGTISLVRWFAIN
jgi:hypothetical protein